MKTSSLTLLRSTLPAAALALAIASFPATGAHADGLRTTHAPEVTRGYVRHADEVTAFGLSDHKPIVVTVPKSGRGYVRRADEVAAFGLSDERPIVVAAPRVGRGYLPPLGAGLSIGLAAGR